MIDLGREMNLKFLRKSLRNYLWWFEWVIRGKSYIEEKHTTFVCTVMLGRVRGSKYDTYWPGYGSLPMKYWYKSKNEQDWTHDH